MRHWALSCLGDVEEEEEEVEKGRKMEVTISSSGASHGTEENNCRLIRIASSVSLDIYVSVTVCVY